MEYTPCFRFKDLNDDIVSDQISYRDDFRRDYARVLHSPSFRRLEGKTQLFPSDESDFFRNRLTHSLEVAQIAKTIAFKLLSEHNEMEGFINPDVCEIAGLVHDLGHPPFGHNGENALDNKMQDFGGFEGNAQTLRILTRLEKKERENYLVDDEKKDLRVGLNLTALSIASCLKYDREIPPTRGENKDLVKGYYGSEKDIVATIKKCVVGTDKVKNFRTIECSIMDLADDIAYSTYDIEDAFKAGFLTPYDLMSADDYIFEQIVNKLKKTGIHSTPQICRDEILMLFADVWESFIEEQKGIRKNDKRFVEKTLEYYLSSYMNSKELAADGYMRTRFSSFLVNQAVNGLILEKNPDYPEHPRLSILRFEEKTGLLVNILKHFAHVSLINSSRLKVAENRGWDIVASIFDKLVGKDGYKLLPEDFQRLYNKMSEIDKKRLICDFIAGMTDRYALEFYGRLHSDNPQTIFKPL